MGAVTDRGGAVLDDPGAAPVASHAAGTRDLAVPGFVNLRDVGGYRVGATATTRWRSLLRADMPREPVDLRALTEVPVGTVIDLRDDDEALETASVFVEHGFHVVRRPVFGGTAESFVSRRVRLPELYAHVITARASGLTDAVRAIADAEASSAVLVHCTAGKDRTGLTVALALRAVGVDRREVVSDYVATEARLRGPWHDRRLAELEEHHGADLSGSTELLFGSPAYAIDHALDLVDRTWGSACGYLAAHGLGPDALGRLRSRIVVPDTSPGEPTP